MGGTSGGEPPQGTDREAAAGRGTDPVKPCVGVLLVHGAGNHGVGATLIEFARPIVDWLDGWLRQGRRRPSSAQHDRARTGSAQILVREADASAPAHVAVCLRPRRSKTTHLWLMAESRWDQAFSPPSFKQVLLWSISVVPWTILTQFVAPLIDEWAGVRANLFSILRFIVDAIVAMVIALVAAVFLQALALVVLLLSIIPLDAVRDIVGRIQRFLSASVGDLYIVLMSPIERAALAGAVQRDIAKLRETCERIVVVAHSQGGFVAYEALSDPWHPTVNRFITLGSGVIRLTESEQAKRRGWLPAALVGTIGLLLVVRFAIPAIETLIGLGQPHQASLFMFELGVALSFAVVWSILTYRRRRLPVPPLPDQSVTWFDYLTPKDPVVNGLIKRRLPGATEQIRVTNRGSITGDHGSYWDNTDQFVSQVALKIGELDPDLDLVTAGPPGDKAHVEAHLRRSWRWRESRVKSLSRMRIAVALATLGLLVVRFTELEAAGQPLAYALGQIPAAIVGWLPDSIEGVLPVAIGQVRLLGAIVVAALSIVAFRVGVWFWDAWGDADTDAQWAGRAPQMRPLDPVENVPPGVRGRRARRRFRRMPKRPTRAVAFYAWAALHLTTIALVAIVGIEKTVGFLGFLVANPDAVVQSLARHYLLALVVSGLVIVALRLATARAAAERKAQPRDPDEEPPVPGWQQWGVGIVVIGTAVGGLGALVLASQNPGRIAWFPALGIGLALAFAGVVIVAVAAWFAPRLVAIGWELGRVVARALDLGDSNRQTAQLPDGLGVAALALPVIGVLLASVGTAGGLALGMANALLGVLACAWMAMAGSRRPLRLVGWAGGILSAIALIAAGVIGVREFVV